MATIAVAECLVQSRAGSSMVRPDIQEPQDTGSHERQDVPTEEGEVEDEGIPLLAVHHALALGKGGLAVHLRVFGDEVRDHVVLVVLDDAGDHKEQAPQRREEVAEEHGLHTLQVIVVKGRCQLPDLSLAVEVGEEKPAAAHLERVEQEGIQSKTDGGNRQDEDQHACRDGQKDAERHVAEGVVDAHMVAVARIDLDAVLADVHRVSVAGVDVYPLLINIDAVPIGIDVVKSLLAEIWIGILGIRLDVGVVASGIQQGSGHPGRKPGRKGTTANRDGEHQRDEHRLPIVGFEACLALGLEL